MNPKSEQASKLKTRKMARRAKSDLQNNLKMTLLVMLISLLNTAGNVPFSVCSILLNFMNVSPDIWYMTFFIKYFYKSGSIFLFYFFNTKYRDILNKYVRNVVDLS